MPFPLTKPEHIDAQRLAAAESNRKVKPWLHRGPWTAAQRATLPYNGTDHGARSLAVKWAKAYTEALSGSFGE